MSSKNQSTPFVSRWGDFEQDFKDRYYLHVPGYVLLNIQYYERSQYDYRLDYRDNGRIDKVTFFPAPKHGQADPITINEMAFIERVMMFRFDTAQGAAKPSTRTLMHLLNYKNEQSITNIKNQLIEKGALTCRRGDYSKSETDEYLFAGLIYQCQWWHQFWMKYQPNWYMRFRFEEMKEWLASEEGQLSYTAEIPPSKILGEGGINSLGGPPQEFWGERIRIKELELIDKDTKVSLLPDGIEGEEFELSLEYLLGSDFELLQKEKEANSAPPNLQNSQRRASSIPSLPSTPSRTKQGEPPVRTPRPSVGTKGNIQSQPDGVVIVNKDKSELEKNTELWVRTIVEKITGKEPELSHLSSYEILRMYARESGVATKMRETARSFATNDLLSADGNYIGTPDMGEIISYDRKKPFVEPNPKMLLDSLFGKNGRRDGWMFSPQGAKLSQDATCTAETMNKWLALYLGSPSSLFKKTVKKQVLPQSDAQSIQAISDSEAEDIKSIMAQMMRRNN